MNVVAKSNLPVVSAPPTEVVRSAFQPSPFKLDHQPVPVQPDHQPVPVKPDHQPVPVKPDHQPVPVKPDHQPAPVKPDHQPANIQSDQPLNIDPHSLKLESNKLKNECLSNRIEDKDEDNHQLAPPIGFEVFIFRIRNHKSFYAVKIFNADAHN